MQEIVPIGVCRRCRAPLEAGDPSVRSTLVDFGTDTNARWEWWTAVALGRMLASRTSSSAPLDPARFPLLLIRAALSFGWSGRALASYLDVSPRSVTQWIRSVRRPGLPHFLAVCMRFAADPAIVACSPDGPFVGSDPVPWESVQRPWPRLRTFRSMPSSPRPRDDYGRWRRIAAGLFYAIDGPDAGRRSLTEIAASLEVSPATVKFRFPEQYAQLCDLHRDHLDRERRRRIETRTVALRQAVRDCVRERRYPAKKLVSERARLSPSFLRLPLYRQLWLSALRRYGVEPR